MEQKLNMSDIGELRKVKSNLLRIKERGTAPINLAKYRKLGLIEPHSSRLSKHSTFGSRDRITSRIRLTEKGKRILATNI